MKPQTVLLVFEDFQDLQTYGSMLCNLGYRILMCDSVADAIKILETKDLSFVMVSQGSGAFEGRQVLERSHQLHPHIPVLVVARVLDTQCYLEAMELGAVDYLERPEQMDIAWVVDTQIRRTGRA